MVGFFSDGKMAWMGLLVALLSGALMSIQGVFNTRVTDTTGVWTANTFVQFSAFAVCLCAWFLMERHSFMMLWQVQPKYMLTGGIIGAFITLTVIMSMAQLGPAKAVLLIVISQLLVAYLISLFGLFGTEKEPFLWRKFIGIAISVIGFILFQWEK